MAGWQLGVVVSAEHHEHWTGEEVRMALTWALGSRQGAPSLATGMVHPRRVHEKQGDFQAPQRPHSEQQPKHLCRRLAVELLAGPQPVADIAVE